MFLMFAKRPWSLRLRLALIFIAGTLSTLLVAVGFLYFGFRHEINTRNQHRLAGKLQDVATVLANHPHDQAALEEEVIGETPSSVEAQIYVRVFKDHLLQIESPGMDKLIPFDRFNGSKRVKSKRHHYQIAERADGPYRIQGALEVTEDDRMTQSYRHRSLYMVVLGAIGCSLFGVWAAHQGLKPLRSIAKSTQGITAQHLNQRLEAGHVPLELRELVYALNDMLDRLDHAFEKLSRFSADLAHELRTPITNLMGEAEVVLAKERPVEEYRQVLESSMEEFRRLSRLISRMLFVARAEDPSADIKPVPIDTEQLLQEVLAFYEALAEEQGLTLTGEASGIIHGDPEMLRQALANLISNAFEATPKGGEIIVKVCGKEGRAELEVKDNGRGIPPEELPHLLDRFFRTADAFSRQSPGTGLGLAIVQSIARLHAGEVEIKSKVGLGTTVRLFYLCHP
jgi:two-component system heavy metal sensor histidine kinase CusS